MTTAPRHSLRSTEAHSNLACPNCQGTRTARIQRLWHEFLRAQPVRYRCRDCERTFVLNPQRQAVLLPKKIVHCWRCGGDIDRRRNRNGIDRIMRMLGLRAYSCRGCNATRYHL